MEILRHLYHGDIGFRPLELTLSAAFLIFAVVHHYEVRSLLQRCCNLVRESRLQLLPTPPSQQQPPCGDHGLAGAGPEHRPPAAGEAMVGNIPSASLGPGQQPAAAEGGSIAEEGRLLAIGDHSATGLDGISESHPICIMQWLSLADSVQCVPLVEHCLDQLFGPDCVNQLLPSPAPQQPLLLPPGPVSVLRAILSCPPLEALMAGMRSGTKDEVLRRVAGLRGPTPSIHQQNKEPLFGETEYPTRVGGYLVV